MKGMRAGVLLLVVGCYRPASFEACTYECNASTPCPPGLSCNMAVRLCRSDDDPCTMRDASIDSPGDGDGDGDGVIDAMDNCSGKPNPEQHDHDNDGRGDVCDPCPHLPALSPEEPDLDNDSDGLGNGCDPNPFDMGDTFVAFHGFYGEQLPTWTFVPSNDWMPTSTSLRMTNAEASAATATPPTPPALIRRLYVAARFVGGTSATARQAIGLRARNGGGYHMCQAIVDAASTELLISNVPANTTASQPWSGVLVGAANVIVLQIDPTRVTCKVSDGADSVTPVMSTTSPLQLTQPEIVIDLMTVDVDYLYVASGKP